MKACVSSMMHLLIEWKKKYDFVYYVKIGESEYVYRSMSRSDYLLVLKSQESITFNVEDVILRECLLYPEFDIDLFDTLLAGEIDYLVKCISSSSGFSEMERVESDLNEQRNLLNNLDNQITILICKAFPHLTLRDINGFTYDELVRYLAISEAILDVKLNIEKPKPEHQGTVDFDAENKVMGAVPFDKDSNIPRGDVSRKKR